jgi:hypothetical protein
MPDKPAALVFRNGFELTFAAYATDGVSIESTTSALWDDDRGPLQASRWSWRRGYSNTTHLKDDLAGLSADAIELVKTRTSSFRTIKAPAKQAIADALEVATREGRSASGPVVLIGGFASTIQQSGGVEIHRLFLDGHSETERKQMEADYASAPAELRERAEAEIHSKSFDSVRTYPYVRTPDGDFAVLGTNGPLPTGPATYALMSTDRDHETGRQTQFLVLAPTGTRNPTDLLGKVTAAKWDQITSAKLFTVNNHGDLAFGSWNNVRAFSRSGPQGPWQVAKTTRQAVVA